MAASTALRTGPSAVALAVPRAHAALEAWLEGERHQLVLWLPVALGVGIAAWFLLPAPPQWIAFTAAVLALATAGWALGGWTGRVLLVGGLLAAAGLGLAWVRADAVAAPRLERERVAVTFDATVIQVEDRSGREQWRLYLDPDDATLPPKVRISLRAAPAAGVEPGARVRLRATLRPPPGPSVPGGYDFARRAWFQGVGAIGFALGPVMLATPAPPPAGPVAWLDRSRARLTLWLDRAVGGERGEGAIAAAFVTGDQGRIDQPTVDAMRDSGLAHLLSIGGMHLAVVMGGVMLATRRLLALSPWIALRWPLREIALVAAALAGIVYTVLAGGQIPMVRATVAALVVLAGMLLGRSALSLRTVAAGAFLILLVRPEALVGPSFQLTFAAVIGLVAAFDSRLGRRILAPAEDEGAFGRVRRLFLGLLLSGIVAEAMLAPTALFHFNRHGFYGVLANLVAIPLTSFLVMPLLVLLLAAGALGVAAPVAWAVRTAFEWLVDLAYAVAAWPGAVGQLATMPVLAHGLFVLGGLWLCLWTGRARLLGAVPIAVAVLLAADERPPDLLVGSDGRHMGVLRADGSLALLRPGAGRFVRDMWGDAVGTALTVPLDAVGSASCGPDTCVIRLRRGGRDWRVLATRSRRLVGRPQFERACRDADIVVSERRLPPWCQPRWLKLDRRALAGTGAVAIWLDDPRVRTAGAGQGAHPWAVVDPGPPPRYGAGDAPLSLR